jgi:hypothetical protein
MLTKFSKEYTDTLQANLVYKNVPEQVAIIGESTTMIRFDIVTNGFESLFYKIKKPRIDLNIGTLYQEGANSIVLTSDDLKNILNDQISNNNSVRSVSGQGLRIDLDPIVSVNLPILVKKNIQYREGFKGIGDFETDPDSVLVSGPKNAIAVLDHIESEQIDLKDVSKNIERELKLVQPESLKIKMEPRSIVATLIVREFTQKQLLLPVELFNVPEAQNVKLLPESVMVAFDISIEDFNTITESDFLLTCDFSTRDESDNSLVLVLEEHPAIISNIVLATQRIEYLIFK